MSVSTIARVLFTILNGYGFITMLVNAHGYLTACFDLKAHLKDDGHVALPNIGSGLQKLGELAKNASIIVC